MADPGFANGEAKVERRVAERRRREYRGAESAERGRIWGGASPSPMGEVALGGGHGPLPRKFFDFESENGDF